ncbi:MAG TPA: amino acid adenylation domain-containing protein, partial [Thermoanaerobaculia bacterium]|nr:amino acid adenylation domain-containing protein [Thermoanaerobaculia bacterium]
RVRDAFDIELPVRAVFEAPAIASLAAEVEALRAAGGALEQTPFLRTDRQRPLPLSFAQERLWFLDQLEPGSSTYNMPLAVRLEGPLDVPALGAALAAVARRHESLRTTFGRTPEGVPVQVIAPAGPLALPVVDLAALPAAAREPEVRRLAGAEAERAFDLAVGPLLRAALLRLAERDHAALVTMHHIVSDGWSMGIFLAELAALYEGSPLPELPIQYADFAAWQRRWLDGEILAGQLAYWRRQLAAAPQSLALTTDRPRPAIQSFRGTSRAFALPAAVSQTLAGLSRREGATPFMTLLAVFQALLGRTAGEEDLVVGSPIAGRNRREVEDLIGLFVNTLALRADLSGDPSFRGLLARVRQMSLDAYAHQDLPFERLVEELQPVRDLSRNPVFQVMFTLQNAPRTVTEMAELTLSPLSGEGGTAKFDLLLSLQEGEDGIRGGLEYNTDLFDEATAVRLLSRFERLLAAVVEDPERRLSQLPAWTEPERHQMLMEWNDSPAVAETGKTLHELFAAQSERTPEAVAVVWGEERWTYRQLARRAGQMARRLVEQGVGPEVRVGVCARRSPDLVAALLGILEAGGAYVPLDPSYPAERLAFMLADAGVRVLLTERGLLPGLPVEAVPTLCLEEVELGADALRSAPRSGPAHLAYVIYTSGSTGLPKGVAIEHRSAVALVEWSRAVFTAAELDGVLAATSVSFDLSVFELFVPLCRGGRVILAQNALELVSLSAADEVRLVNTVPSAMAELVRMGALRPGVVMVNLAGEALPGALAERLYDAGVERVLNLYGPSEDTTYSTGSRVEPGADEPAIGRPIAGTRAYVLDRAQEPVPLGTMGELYLGGAGLARGYLGRPQETADRFVPDALGGRPGERLYRTGDLVRYRPDGELEFLGRADHQVKVRGFRIELGEIESALSRCPGVREAAVLVREDRPGDRRLVAYVAGEAQDLESALRRTLPEPWIPSAFVLLDSLPLTPNGKVDRRALARRAPDVTRPELESAYVAPRTPVEEVVAAVWGDVLGLERVGAQDNFFTLGGHSLMATRVVSRLREALRLEVPLRDLFEAPTVSGLAGRVERALRAGQGLEVPPVQSVARDRPLPLSFAQQRLWFLDQLDPGSPAYNLPAAVRLSGSLVRPVLAAALGEIVRRHESLRTTFGPVGPGEPVQVIAAPPEIGLVALPVVDLSALPEAAREAEALRLAGEEAQRPFDLERGPLLRVTLVATAATEHAVLLTLHHAVGDAWSIGLLVQELGTLYTAFAAGRPSPLPELGVQYADFAHWQRQWLAGEVMERQIAWWRERLAGASILELPVDRPRPAVRTARGGNREVRLPRELSEGLATLARQLGATPFMTLLAGFQALLARYASQPEVSVGTPIAGRNHLRTEGLIGFFVNTLVLRTELGDDPGFATLVSRVRETALGAYAHQDLPFEKLVEELSPRRDLSRTPLFEVMFSLQNVPVGSLELPGLTLGALPTGSGTTKFDLNLSLSEDSEGIAGSLAYSADLFEAATAERLARHLRVLFEGAVAAPERRLRELPLLAGEERHQLLVEWNDTAGSRKDACLQDLFEAQAARTPDVVAVVFEEEQLSFAELDRRSARLARHLRRLGVGPESRVALCVERSLEMVVGLLGILRAGAAYVPLDPAHPHERRAAILDDLGPETVLLTRQDLLAEVPDAPADL